MKNLKKTQNQKAQPDRVFLSESVKFCCNNKYAEGHGLLIFTMESNNAPLAYIHEKVKIYCL